MPDHSSVREFCMDIVNITLISVNCSNKSRSWRGPAFLQYRSSAFNLEEGSGISSPSVR